MIEMRKTVFFIMKYPLEDDYNIIQKLNGQMQAFERIGYDVYYLSFDRKHVYLNQKNNRSIVQNTTFGFSKLYFHFFSFFDIYHAANTVLNQINANLIYFRYGPLNPSGIKLFKTASKTSAVVVEVPTYPVDNESQKTGMRRLYMRYSSFLWRSAAKYISLFTIIGEKADSWLGVPALNIDNGISVDTVPITIQNNTIAAKRHLLAVASMCSWQAYDRIILGLFNWNNIKKNDYIIDLVGDDGDGSLSEWKKLAHSLGMDKQVVFHGRLTGDSLDRVFDTATIGLSSLGMYRKGMSSGSVLKLREYMARGLPFIYAHDDPALSDAMPWCIRFPNDETPIDMEKVDSFIDSLSKVPAFGEQMRQYASEMMSWDAQFEKVRKQLTVLTGKEF